MSPAACAFAWLTQEQFLQLSTDAKIMYLAEAIDALASERGSIFVGPTPQRERTLQ
jgi:hypothetical protein